MTESFPQKLKNEARAFCIAPVFPFMQKDWPLKMWLFIALSYVPVVNVMMARGWRMDYVRRLGWTNPSVLPNPKDSLKFLRHGLLLTVTRFLFAVPPIIIIFVFGLGGFIDLWNDIVAMFQLCLDFFWRRSLKAGEFFSALYSFGKQELLHTVWAFFIENIWLLIYVPVYRIGMIRFALTGKLLQSHGQVRKNFRFLFRNLVDIILMYTFNIFNFVVIFIVDTLLYVSVIGTPLIPIVTFYMSYWNTGYEYGLLARQMVKQEGLSFEN